MKACLLLLFTFCVGLASCKKCPEEVTVDKTPAFGFWLLDKETGLPLVTNDTAITTYPPGSVKLIDEGGNGWNDRGRDYPPNGYGFGSYLAGFDPPPNDTAFYYLHFLSTGDVDTIKIIQQNYEHDCRKAVRFRYFYAGHEVPIDSSSNENTTYRADQITLYKKL